MQNIKITKTIFALNVVVFLLMIGYQGASAVMNPTPATIVAFGGDYGPLTLNGEYLRVVTCMFVHIGIFHLAMNMWGLWVIGGICELIFGASRYSLVYFLSGIGGSLASLYMHPNGLSAGASGALFGLCGALCAVLLLGKDRLPHQVRSQLLSSMILIIFINLLIGASIPGIDLSAHVGGLVTGAVAATVLGKTLA